MKYPEMLRMILKTVSLIDCLRIVPCVVFLFVSLSVSGCATGKSGEETTKEIVNKPPPSRCAIAASYRAALYYKYKRSGNAMY